MKQYKVVKEFGSARKGDMLSYDEDTKLFTFDIVEDGDCRFMAMDEDTADKFAEDEYLLVFEEGHDCDECEDEEYCECYEKLNRIDNLIQDLKKQYDEDHTVIKEKYNNQEIPTCVKVEADTVYFNMNKILNKIADIINE